MIMHEQILTIYFNAEFQTATIVRMFKADKDNTKLIKKPATIEHLVMSEAQIIRLSNSYKEAFGKDNVNLFFCKE